MKCSVHKKTSVCEVQGINSYPVFLMDLDLRPRVWHNEVGINPPYFMGCQLIPPPRSTAPQRSPGSVRRAAVDGVSFGKVWGAPRLQRHQAKPGTTFPAARGSAQLWEPSSGSPCRGRLHQPPGAQAGAFPMPQAGMQAWGTAPATPRRAGGQQGPLCPPPQPGTGSVATPAGARLLSLQPLPHPPCRTPGLCSPPGSSASPQGGCKGKDANSIAHPSRFAPLKIRFGLGTCLCSCTLR